MRSKSASRGGTPVALKLGALVALLFLHLPMAVVVLYAFTTDESTFRFPLPGVTLEWFGVAWGRTDVWEALSLSLQVASMATVVALVLGSLAAGAGFRSKFFGRETISFLLVLPLALPGVVRGVALR